MSSVSLWDVAARPEVHSKGPSHSRPTPTLLPALLALAPTPAALNAVPDFKTPAVWGEIDPSITKETRSLSPCQP